MLSMKPISPTASTAERHAYIRGAILNMSAYYDSTNIKMPGIAWLARDYVVMRLIYEWGFKPYEIVRLTLSDIRPGVVRVSRNRKFSDGFYCREITDDCYDLLCRYGAGIPSSEYIIRMVRATPGHETMQVNTNNLNTIFKRRFGMNLKEIYKLGRDMYGDRQEDKRTERTRQEAKVSNVGSEAPGEALQLVHAPDGVGLEARPEKEISGEGKDRAGGN